MQIKYKHVQIIIGILGLLLIPINVYFNGHFLINIAMLLLAFGMGIKAYQFHQQEEKTGPLYFRKENLTMKSPSFFLMTLALAGIGIFFTLEWWILFSLSVIIAVFSGIFWFKEIKKNEIN